MALLGAYKPKYETTFSGVAKQAPISSVVSLGLVPAIGSLAGKVLETGRAMFSDTGDPMAMVKGRTQQVAGELSDYANGKAGKPTITTPLAPATATAAPAKQAAITDIGTTYGDVGLPKMGPKDLSKLSSGALPPGKPARRAPVRNTGTKPATTTPTAAPISEVPNDGLQTPGYQVPGTNNITRIDNVAPGQFNSDFGPQGVAAYNTPAGGGIASNGDETFVLRGRTPAEEATFKTQQAQAQNTQPITVLAQPAQQTSTVGYGHGVYELAPGQNAPPDFNAMSLGDMASYKFGVNQQVKQAGIANINSEMTRRAAQTQLETNIQPSQINQNNASARHANVSADLGIFKAPAEVENIKAVTAQHTALANETNALLDLKGKNMISEIDYRKGMLDIGNKKLGLLTKQYDARIAQMKQSKDVPDYKLIADIAKAKAKTYQEISALGALTPDQTLDMQKQNDILNLVQRHATKSSAQYAGPATTITDDET